ncbi:MAG: ATP phosphoribosyltransferase [Candidatus Sumerlaeia bacterium]
MSTKKTSKQGRGASGASAESREGGASSGRQLRFGLPKGSLQESTLALFDKAGWSFQIGSRSYYASSDDPELWAVLVRAQEIARYVENGHFDAGITGLDWIRENRARVIEVADLVYSKASMRPVRWVLAVKEDSPIRSVKDLNGRRIATEAVNLVKDYLKEHGVSADVEFSWGATEVKVPDLVDAIVDVTETGSSLKANKLRVVDTLLESWPRLIANRNAWRDPWKRRKIENMALLLKGAIEAEGRVCLKMNVPRRCLDAVLAVLPSITSPTINELKDPDWVAIETVMQERQVRDLAPELKRAGATGIIEFPLNKIVY